MSGMTTLSMTEFKEGRYLIFLHHGVVLGEPFGSCHIANFGMTTDWRDVYLRMLFLMSYA